MIEFKEKLFRDEENEWDLIYNFDLFLSLFFDLCKNDFGYKLELLVGLFFLVCRVNLKGGNIKGIMML